MEQKKIGLFLRTLRKEKGITQEALAEVLNVSARTVSRWETGSNMPDISLLVELSEFYDVGISEIIDGERKSDKMNQETKAAAVKMAEYSQSKFSTEKMRIIGAFLTAFGVFVIISALAVFPSESSWGSIYAIVGGAVLTVGICLIAKALSVKKGALLPIAIGCIVLLFGIFTLSDYVAVTEFNQVPRFSYEKSYGEGIVEHKTLFYTVIQKNPGSANEIIEIIS